MNARKHALGALAVAALAWITPAPASAFEYVTKEGSVTYGQSTVIKRGCPGGRHPIGGGIRAPRFLEQQVASLGPYDGPDPDLSADDGWATRVDGFALATVPLKLIVACSRTAPVGIQTIHTSIAANSTLGWDNADCQAGSHAIGGGTYTPAGWGELGLVASYPLDSVADQDSRPDDSWLSTAYNGSGGTRQVSMAGLCGKGQYEYVQEEEPVTPGGEGRARVRCSAGTQLASGGFRVTGAPSLVALSAAFPRDGADADRRPEDIWTVRVEDFGGGERTLTAHAVCK